MCKAIFKKLLVLSFILASLVSCGTDVKDPPKESDSHTSGGHSGGSSAVVSYEYSLSRNIDGDIVSDKDYVVCIQKEAGKDFIVLNLADPHITNSADLDSVSYVVNQLISYKKPDLITITGDYTDYGTKDEFINFCNYINSLQIPWAPVFGNHDPEGLSYTLKQQSDKFLSYSNCIYKEGPDLGYTNEPIRLMTRVKKYGNYIVDIIEDNGQDFSLVKSLYMMNSGSFASSQSLEKEKYSEDFYDNLNDKQLKFYSQSIGSAQQYGKNGSVSSALIMHIPLTKYVDAINAARIKDLPAITLEQSYDSQYWNEGYKDSFGIMKRSVSCKMYDDEIFEVIKDKTDLVLCGHDHTNCFAVRYDGVLLAYSLKTGYTDYYTDSVVGGTFVTIQDTGNVLLEHKAIADK